MSAADHDIYAAAGAALRQMVRNEAYRLRNESAEFVDWADQSEEAKETYRADEARRINAVEGK